MRRGFTAAALGEPADGVEERHPRLIAAARTFFHPVLDSSYIARRLREVSSGRAPVGTLWEGFTGPFGDATRMS